MVAVAVVGVVAVCVCVCRGGVADALLESAGCVCGAVRWAPMRRR